MNQEEIDAQFAALIEANFKNQREEREDAHYALKEETDE
jgi:hypothetical protein